MASSGDASQAGLNEVDSSPTSRKKKLFAFAVVVIIVVSVTVLVWNQYFRYWTIEDVGAAVTDDVLEPGFRHSLANRTIIVKGTVTNISGPQWLAPTTLGTLYLVELDDFGLLHLVYWNQVPFNVGDRVKAAVSFEWSCYNEEAHVYSPQLDFPVLFSVLGIATVTFATSLVSDIYWTASSEGNNVTVFFDWIGEDFSLDEMNCSLRAGQNSFTQEYIDVLRYWCYGVEIDRIDLLSHEDGEAGLMVYSDSDGDGNLSSGDSLTVRGLSLPESDSGIKCYMILLGWNFDELTDDKAIGLYLPLTNRGLLIPDHSCGNFVRFDDYEIDGGFGMDVEYSLNNTYWSDTEAVISWDFNCSDHYMSDPICLPLFGEGVGLDDNPIWRSDPLIIGDASWTLEVIDANYDGVVNVGDSVSLITDQEESIPTIEVLTVWLMYQPNDTEIGRVTLISSE